MKDFLTYFNESPFFNNFLDSLRNFLIDFTVKQDNYMTVVKRMNFYYSHISNSEERKKLKVPKESCINVVIRRLFTSKPHPYHYDYFTLTAKEKAFDESLYMIRQVFGYSCRKSSFKDDNNNHSKKSMRSEKSEKSFVSSNKSGVGSFQRFRSKPSRSAGYPPINLQTISVNNMSGAFPASTRHKYSCGNKPFSPKRELSKSKIAPEEESNKNAE